ncbi:flavin reductase family protein [Streptomyces rectiverticillatus]|uniref:flavin reductase family protein n=1 Tax=Streptomyces rectiverticillatus TaxID=173860 RepID=UPI0015C2D57E|nr:flavin reductase family protein [Streptomyces rectiverticillatus]QLE72939.1 flavin reductase family protein [Streptomyces rectiverticillatus]
MLAETITAERFRTSLARWASGVTVVTTVDAQGRSHGFTASSFTSVSLEPPLVLVCLDLRANCFDAFTGAEGFVVHVLGRDQQDLAALFARKGAEKFPRPGTVRSRRGLPLLPGALARLECRTERQVPAGDHLVLFGEVEHAEAGEGEPLLYYRKGFHGIAGPGAAG